MRYYARNNKKNDRLLQDNKIKDGLYGISSSKKERFIFSSSYFG